MITDWDKYLNRASKSGLSSRNQLYMHSKEIYCAMLASFHLQEGIKNKLKFNLAIAKDKLVAIYGLDHITQVFKLA